MRWVVRDAIDEINRRWAGAGGDSTGSSPDGLNCPKAARRRWWPTGGPGVTAYLQTMFVRPGERGCGVGAALVRHVHTVLDARGEVRPASALR